MSVSKNRPAGLILGVLVVVALVVSGCAGVPAAVKEDVRTVTVSGTGEASGAPDIANLDLGYEAKDGDLDAALAESNQTIEAITAALIALGVEEKDIQTRDFNVWMDERFDDAGNPTGVSIYYVNNTVHVTVRDISVVGDIIAAGLSAGANRVLGLTFGIEETDALMADARQLAIDNARVQAEQLAAGLGMRLGDPIAISEGYMSSPLPVRTGLDTAMGMGGAVPVSEGTLTLTSQVTIVYELLP